MKIEQLNELLFQALETEIGGQRVYASAIECAEHPELRKEWEKYREETRQHEHVLREAFEHLGLDPEEQSPGRAIVRSKADSLVSAMQQALDGIGKPHAQLVAAECVVEAETKDHQNWELIGMASRELDAEAAQVLRHAFDQVEDQEDQHLYHTMGWARELWLDSLGMAAVLPPPEEEQDVRTAIDAARARQQRQDSL